MISMVFMIYSQVPGKLEDGTPRTGKVTRENSKNQDLGSRLPPLLQTVAKSLGKVSL